MNETIKTLMERASCRAFKNVHVTGDMLDTIADAGLKAPTGKNLQSPRLVVVTNDDTVKKLSELNAAVAGISADPFYGARDVIVVLAEKQSPFRVYDGSLAVGNVLNAAFSLGLGATWINRAKEVFDSDEGKALLHTWGVEGEMEGIAFCIIGERAQEAAPKAIAPGRKYYVR